MRASLTEIILSKDGVELVRKTVAPGDYVIGRTTAADIAVDEEGVSARHAQLTVNDSEILIEDLGSSNGTFVNGQRVTEATRLWPNQRVTLGPVIAETRRLKTPAASDGTLTPQEEALHRILPEEFLRQKKYDIGGVVAQGGMGAILNATEATTERTVAMKVMLRAPSPEDMVRFIAEAKITAQLEHPSIVPVYELSVDENGQVFYTMKFVRGITLKKVLELRAGGTAATLRKYPLAALLTVFQKVCDAVAFAHSKRVLHRDLKPENVMIGDFGEVLVMDWGLAKILDQSAAAGPAVPMRSMVRTTKDPTASATMAGTVMGTPQYMSPEQARGEVERLDARADIYALGAILYHILALRPPIAGGDAWGVVERAARGEIEPLAGNGVPDSLGAVVRKAMALDRDARYPSVATLQADITAFQNGFATGAEKAGAWKQLKLLILRSKAASIGVAAVLIVGVSFGTQAVIEGRRAEREATHAKAALAELKKTAPTMLALAESEASFQRFDSALEKLDAALALDPQMRPAYWRRAWVLVGQQKFAAAAAAARRAAQMDPANARLADISSVLDAFAAAPAQERWKPEQTLALTRFLTQVGASGEMAALASQLKLAAKDKGKLVTERFVQWLGKDAWQFVTVNSEGLIQVDLYKSAVDRLDPLHGLPIDTLRLTNTQVTTLEPLRGMHLRELVLSGTPVADLQPVRGMPLRKLFIGGSKVIDLSPVQGMPLEEFSCEMQKVSDFSPLAGAPLRIVKIGQCGANELRFLAAAPLEELWADSNPFADLSPLRGKPLRKLHIAATAVSDLSSLAGEPIDEIDVHSDRRLKDFGPLLKLPKLVHLRVARGGPSLDPLRRHPSLQFIAYEEEPYRPVAEFWAAFDAEKK